MILTQIKAHLAAQGPAALPDLAARFQVAPAAMAAMLGQLVRRGVVRRGVAGGACGGCTRCDLHARELFEWAGPRRPGSRCVPGCRTDPAARSAAPRR